MTEIEPTATAALSSMDYGTQMAAFEDLWENPHNYGAAVVDEGTLEKDKERLLGVPFSIHRVTYQSNFDKSERGYITLEARIAPQKYIDEQIARELVPPQALPVRFKPGEVVKVNDGSTGIRRQVTKMLHQANLIDVGPMDTADIERTFDRPWTEWVSFAQTSQQNGPDQSKVDVPDFVTGPSGRPLAIVVHHGLRVSIEPQYDTAVYYLG